MDTTKKYINPSPENVSNSISRLCFWWLLPFIKYSYRNNIEVKDVYNTTEADLSENLTNVLESHWINEMKEAEDKNRSPKLITAIKKTFLKPYAKSGSLFLLRALLYTYFVPVMLAGFIDSFSEVPRNKVKAWYSGCAVIFLNFISSIVIHHSALTTSRIGMRVRIACSSLIYRKVLRLNKLSLGDTHVGQLINLLSNDVNRFDLAASFSHFIWVMPIQAIIGVCIMYRSIGVAALPGMAAMTIQALLFQGKFSTLQGKWRLEIARKTDTRVKLMTEIINGIQVIKMYTWEKPFEQLITLLRKYEIHSITKTSYIKALSAAIAVYTERLTLYIVVITYVLLGNSLSGGIVFSMFQIINSLQLYISILFPLGLSTYSEAKTSILRIEEFLTKREREEFSDQMCIMTNNPGHIKLDHVHANWTSNPGIDTLIDISLELKPGSFCCIFGGVGSGKSSLLHLVLNELPLNSGKMQIGGTVSYACQMPWLFTSTIRNNILFGKPYNEEKYNTIIEVCALQRDFRLFPFGDKTNVGEKGASLSGGQRARINLARSVYSDADIYLLDDPLSAVDPAVAEHLFENCILKHLHHKTRILVTHQAQFLSRAHFVLVLCNGKVEKFINSSELSNNEFYFMREENDSNDHAVNIPKRKQSSVTLKCYRTEEENVDPQETEELIERGTLSASVYKEYFKAGDSTLLLIFDVFIFVIGQLLCNTTDLWVTYWTNNIESQSLNGTRMNVIPDNLKVENSSNTRKSGSSIYDEHSDSTVNNITRLDISNIFGILRNAFIVNETSYLSTNIYIQIYTLLIILAVILTTARTVLVFKVCMRASKNLHNSMFKNILRTTMRFFDTNPSGRILNRFSKDIGAIDEILPSSILSAMQATTIAAGIIIITFLKSYWMIPPCIITGYVLYWLQKIFMKSVRDVKRLEATTKAPLFSYIAASLDGLSTIRSANAQEMVKKEFDIIQDQHTSTWFLFTAAYEAFGFYMDMVSVIYLFMVTVQFLLNDNSFGGDVGLVISQSLVVIVMIQFTIRYITDVVSTMTSVERVLQYTKLDKECELQSLPVNGTSRKWPEAGIISFRNVYLRYAANKEPVLKNLNIRIEHNEKIGVVGRTGAGKSSLISALFRLAPIEGTIEIDYVDIAKVRLKNLRSQISIIPQEPVLFTESIRYNLDPFGKCDDKTLWKALESVELKNAIESLDMKVCEGGSNFSAGQRQLICLARAIVKNNNILVLDEATANVDSETDALIQKSIRHHFKNCTVITIAHRLNTIMDSDRVLVLDAGEIMEFAPPYELLQNRDGYLSNLVAKTGIEMDIHLREIAEKHYKIRKKNHN